MRCVPILLIPLAAAAVLYLRYRMSRSRPSDYEAIGKLLMVRGLNPIAVPRDNYDWRYWIRGKLILSTCARISIVEAQGPSGDHREIHVAFDAWVFGHC
jgi:hypothetical protein